eukprot:1672534-Amphidinium_carterae.1
MEQLNVLINHCVLLQHACKGQSKCQQTACQYLEHCSGTARSISAQLLASPDHLRIQRCLECLISMLCPQRLFV